MQGNFTNSNDKTPDSAPTNSNVYSGLNSFVENVGDTFKNLQQVIFENEKRLSDIVSAMNSMMEITIKQGISSNILVESVALTREEKLAVNPFLKTFVRINIQLKNSTKFPIQNAKVSLKFISSTSNSLEITSGQDSNGEIKFWPLTLIEEQQSGDIAYQSCASFASLSSSFNIQPLSSIKCSLTVGISKKEQIECIFDVLFPNPGTLAEIKISNKFFLYLLYQFSRSFTTSHNSQEYSKLMTPGSFEANINHIRKLFFVPPSSGVQPGSTCKLSSEANSLSFEITRLVSDSTAECTWLAPSLLANDFISEPVSVDMMKTISTEITKALTA